jgi:hypothetical protein
MTGQIAGPSIFTLELVGAITVLAMVIGAIDLIHLPGWAWKRAEESKAAHLVLVLLLPLVGLAIYVLGARTKVAAIASAGRAASLPFERFGEEAGQKQRQEHREDGWPVGTIAPPVGFEGFTSRPDAPSSTITEDQVRMVETVTGGGVAPTEVSGTFFSTGAAHSHSARSTLTLARPYRPKQRDSLPQSSQPAVQQQAAVASPATPTVPAGWKADPTGRHQFRYWDGFQWTENVADAGEQARDAVSA